MQHNKVWNIVQLLPAQLNILRPTKLASIAQQLPEQNILRHHQACLDICWHHVDQTGNRMFVSFNIVIYIYWLIRLFWTLDLNFDRKSIYHNMILEPFFDQIWSIMSKVLWLNFCILLCAFDTYGECICFSLTSRRCSFLLWHFNFASHRICSEMGQVGSSSFSVAFVRKQSCCLSADTKTIVSPKKTFQVHSCGLNQAIAISGGVHPCALELVILIYLRWLHWPGGAQHRGWQLGLGMVGDFGFLGHFCCFAISWCIFKFQISRGHGSRLCSSSKIIVQWYVFFKEEKLRWFVTDVQRLSLALMSMEPICKDVMTSQVAIRLIITIIILIIITNHNHNNSVHHQIVKLINWLICQWNKGVPVSVAGVARVKVMREEPFLRFHHHYDNYHQHHRNHRHHHCKCSWQFVNIISCSGWQ